MQFQYDYYFRSFTVTSPILLFLDLCKHTFSKTEAMQLSTGNTLNIESFLPITMAAFHIVYAILFLKGLVTASLRRGTNDLY